MVKIDVAVGQRGRAYSVARVDGAVESTPFEFGYQGSTLRES